MINKYPGTCACGARVAAGGGEARKADGRWTVVCPSCGVADAPGARGPATATIDAPTALDAPRAAAQAGYTLLSGHLASPYQAAVFDDFRYGRGSVIVKAGAGAGKTTTLKNALRYLPERASVQLFAFGREPAAQLKDAVAELEARETEDAVRDGRAAQSYRQVRAGTFHSVCMRAVRRHLGLPEAQVRVDPDKCRDILRALLGDGEEGRTTYAQYGSFVTALLRFAKGEGIGCLVPDTEERWWELVEHHDLHLDSTEAEPARGVAMARDLLGRSNAAAKTGWLDFEDQLYCVVLWKLRLWQNDVVCLDEAQDTSLIRRAIARLALKPNGRLIAVGDECQCHPAGTGVYVSGRGYVPIEDVSIGDKVLTYANGYFRGKVTQGRAILDVARRHYNGDMITISAGDFSHDHNAESPLRCAHG